MQITKEILLAHKQAYLEQIKGLNSAIVYIDQLIAFLDKPEPEITLEQQPNE